MNIEIDPITGRPVLMATGRHERPSYVRGGKGEMGLPGGKKMKGVKEDPFAWGNEEVTGPEVWAVRQKHGVVRYELTNTADWRVRVISNKYPLTEWHEVVIHSPEATKDFDRLSSRQAEWVLEAYLARYRELSRKGQVFIFCNHGREAGATVDHPHSQILALPTLPPAVSEKVERVERYFKQEGECLYCRLIAKEMKSGVRVVWQNEHFLLLCPEGSMAAYQLTLLPKIHQAQISSVKRGERKSEDQIKAWAEAVQVMVSLYAGVLAGASYNYWINSVKGEFFHWQMEMVPRLNVWGGVEVGAGLMINDRKSPEMAAKEFREFLRGK